AFLHKQDDHWRWAIVSTGTGAGAGYVTLTRSQKAVIVAYTTGDSSVGGGSDALYARRSRDGGVTWSTPVRIAGHHAHAPHLISLDRRNVALLWTQSVHEAGRESEQVWFARSSNAATSWQKSERLRATRDVDHISVQPLRDESALVLVQS